jgi:hypothetical protein
MIVRIDVATQPSAIHTVRRTLSSPESRFKFVATRLRPNGALAGESTALLLTRSDTRAEIGR